MPCRHPRQPGAETRARPARCPPPTPPCAGARAVPQWARKPPVLGSTAPRARRQRAAAAGRSLAGCRALTAPPCCWLSWPPRPRWTLGRRRPARRPLTQRGRPAALHGTRHATAVGAGCAAWRAVPRPPHVRSAGAHPHNSMWDGPLLVSSGLQPGIARIVSCRPTLGVGGSWGAPGDGLKDQRSQHGSAFVSVRVIEALIVSPS
jgi:hypothetical protein